jgi:hypothetical protein
VWVSRRYTNHGSGPADGALYSAVSTLPVSSTRAGQPSAAQRAAIAETVFWIGELDSSAFDDRVEIVGAHA